MRVVCGACVCVVFGVHAGLPHGCVHRRYSVLQGRCAQQGVQQARFVSGSDKVSAGAPYISFLPAFMGFPPQKTEGSGASPGFRLISSCAFSKGRTRD